MENLQQTKTDALKVKNANDMPFVTIWETKTRKSTSYGFNFESKNVGFSTKIEGVKRTVLEIL